MNKPERAPILFGAAIKPKLTKMKRFMEQALQEQTSLTKDRNSINSARGNGKTNKERGKAESKRLF